MEYECRIYRNEKHRSSILCVQLEQQQSEKVAEAEKSDKTEESVIQLMKSKASFLLKFSGCVNVQSRVEVIFVFLTVYCSTE